MLERVLRQLACPSCTGPLDRSFPAKKSGGRIRLADLECRGCRARYGIREGVGLFAEPLETDVDWRPDPGLLARPPDERVWEAYLDALPAGVREALDTGIRRVAHEVPDLPGLVVDLATCRGHLLRPVAARSGHHQLLVGLDLAPSQLYATQAILRQERRYANVSLLEIAEERWPLRDGCASAAMSFYGTSIVPHGARWLSEMARILRPDAPWIFLALLTRERTLTLREAARTGEDELLTEGRLRRALTRAGLRVEAWDVLAEGRSWPRNPYDPLPVEGDPWQHVLVHARRKVRRSAR